MRFGFYLKLALSGIRNNKKTYVPYILTGIGMVMMYYIVSFLSCSSSVAAMHGGDVVREFLSLGSNVIGLFALILLFYTNSFLMKRRKKEFGLYNRRTWLRYFIFKSSRTFNWPDARFRCGFSF